MPYYYIVNQRVIYRGKLYIFLINWPADYFTVTLLYKLRNLIISLVNSYIAFYLYKIYIFFIYNLILYL